MNTYKIWVEICGGYYTNVEAESFDKAIDIAIGNANPYEVMNWDYDAEITDWDYDAMDGE